MRKFKTKDLEVDHTEEEESPFQDVRKAQPRIGTDCLSDDTRR